MTSANNQPRTIPVADLQKSLTNQVATLDPQRAGALNGLAAARSAKASTLEHEQKLAALKYGAGSARGAALAAQQLRNAGLQTALTFQVVRAETPAPQVTAETYVFHGFVLDAQQQPVEHVTVALYDESGHWQREFGYGCTDGRGYFLLRLETTKAGTGTGSGTTAQSVPPPPATAPAMSSGSTTTDKLLWHASAGGATASSGRALDVLVFDAKKTLLHREAQPLQPQLGRADYRVIILDGGVACTPPPVQAQPGPRPEPGPVKSSLKELGALRKKPAAQTTAAERKSGSPATERKPGQSKRKKS